MKRKSRNLFFHVCLLAAGIVWAQSESLDVSKCRVVLAADAGANVRYAAEELAGWTEKMTGVKLPVAVGTAEGPCVVIRQTDAYGEDGFRLHVQDGRLFVEGGVRGVLYGVYELLETYGGIGWFSPTRTVVPKRDAFAVPTTLDVVQKPTFELREPLWAIASWDADFAARLRLNGNSPRLTARHGGKSHRFGGGLGNCHTFSKLVPAAKYGKEHPEYFAMRGGHRHVEAEAQLCLSNPDVLKIVTAGVLDAIRRDPTAKYYGVSQNDNQTYCECPACAAIDAEEESHAGAQVRFVNAVAEAVEREFPDKIVETLAYQYTRKPPKKTRLRKNVMPCLCTIECDYAHPLATGLDKQNVSFRDDIRGWAAQTDRLYVWDYTVDFAHYPGVFPNFDVLQSNIRFFRSCGVTSLFEQGCHTGHGAEFEALKAWLISKWLWNPDLEEGPLLDRFFAGYYGKAAPFARQYFDELRAIPRPDGKFRLGCFSDIVEQTLVSDDFLRKGRALWDRAEAAVKGTDPVAWTNVLYGAFSVDYMRYSRRKDASASSATFHVRRTRPELTDEVRELAATAERLAWLMDADPHVRLCENREESAKRAAAVRRAAASVRRQQEFAPCDRAVFEESDFKLAGVGNWCRIVEDAEASGGKALKLFATDYQWCVQMAVPYGAFDPGVRYRVRVRAKFEKKPDAPDVNVVNAGVYDPTLRKGVAHWRQTAARVADRTWEWVDLGMWTPTPTQGYFWLSSGIFDRKKDGVNRAIDALYVDQLEITRGL